MITHEWLRDLHQLKRTPRTGWTRVGIDAPESVADHTFGAALIAWRVSRAVPGIDAERVVLMALVHDFHEAKLTDIPTPWKRYFPDGAIAEAERRIAAEQWHDDPEALALVEEVLAGETEEAKLFRAIDHLEFLLQASEYRASGHLLVEEMLQRGPQGPAFAHPATRAVAEELLGDLAARD